MSQHAVLAPSGAEKWMPCPGAPAMERGLPDDANEYTDEGTAAHLLGSTCFETGKNPVHFEGREIYVGWLHDFDGAVWDHPSHSDWVCRRTYTVDDEMIEAVGRYVDTVRHYAMGALLMLPERRVSIEFLTGEKDAAGTADATIVIPRELQVHDLKYGMGVKVSAVRNKQLMIYALGNREELEMAYGPFERFRFVIHQPRLPGGVEEWDCTPAELDAFADEVRAAAAKSLEILRTADTIAVEMEDLNPSEDACRWCKAKATCPKLAQAVQDSTQADFEAVTTTLPSDPADFKVRFRHIGMIEDYCKAIRARGEAMLFENQNSPEIIEALGIKLVEGKRGNRTWRSEAEARKLLKQDMRMTYEECFKMTLLSPPAIEKVLKATPKRWARVLKADLIAPQRPGVPSVAPASDKRPAWAPPDTASDFTAVEPATEEESIA